MTIIWIKLASIFMFLGVALGAFGAHALRLRLGEHYMEVYKTAVLYQFVHALGLFAVAWLSSQIQDPKINLGGWMFVLGIVLFSGSLYILSITQIKIFGAITPLGGLAFLAGWILIFAGSCNKIF